MVHVRSYRRWDGTRVRSHYRSRPGTSVGWLALLLVLGLVLLVLVMA